MSYIDDLFKRYLENKASDKDRSELMSLIRLGNLESEIKDRITESLRAEMHSEDVPDHEMKAKAEAMFRMIVEKSKTTPDQVSAEKTKNTRSSGWTTAGIHFIRYAAAFLVLGVVGVSLYTGYTRDDKEHVAVKMVDDPFIQVVNTEAVARQLTLHDGSTVMLQPGSEVRYPAKFEGKREVYLTGDAFFEVTKDAGRPFLVYTNEVTTKVLGTSFRVKANRDDKEIMVTVKTGKVSVFAKSADEAVSNSEQQEITLTPNQQAIYKRNEHIVLKKLVEEPEVIVPQTVLKSNYVNEPVVHILGALSRSYGVQITYDVEALSGCSLTSDTIEGEGLFEQLEIVCNALGGSYRMESDASISIEASGCK